MEGHPGLNLTINTTLPEGITWAPLPLPAPSWAGLILFWACCSFGPLIPSARCHTLTTSLQPPCRPAVTARVGGERRRNWSWPSGQRAIATWLSGWGGPCPFFCLEPHLSHQPEQAQACHIISTSGESTAGPIPGAGAWGWILVTECGNRALGLWQV